MRGLKRGALVMLRSGGPEMVIERIDTLYGSPDRYATCKWFDRARLRTERFAIHTLELSEPAPETPIKDVDDAVYMSEIDARTAEYQALSDAIDAEIAAEGGEADAQPIDFGATVARAGALLALNRGVRGKPLGQRDLPPTG